MEFGVHCYAGYRGEQGPLRFSLGERGIEVLEIIDRRLSPEHRYVKVKGDDQRHCIIAFGHPAPGMGAYPARRWTLGACPGAE